MKRVLRVREGKELRPFAWQMVWNAGFILVSIITAAFLLGVLISTLTDSGEAARTRAQKINECAAVFNELSEEQREKLSYCLEVALDENGFIVPASVEAAEEAADFTISDAWDLFLNYGWWILLLAFLATTFTGYVTYRNMEQYKKNGATYIRRVQQNGEDVSYFLADIPDGKSKIPFIILVVVPFWPVFLISWLRLNHFKKKNQMQKAGS
ncbi:MAG: hypothetical protein Q4B34_01715 [Candidatus Saccharibacteria bacterium]|nr:hypothetical protein [Candidatus Saccharibacteria bacterium]